VIDPLCADLAAPVLVEAIRQRRHAAVVIGHDPSDAHELEQRITDARQQGASSDAVLLRGDPSELPHLLAQQGQGLLRRQLRAAGDVAVHPAGSANLIVVSLPAALLLGRRQRASKRWRQPFSAHDLLNASAVVLRPGGFLAAVTGGPQRQAIKRDLGGETVSLCAELGLAYWQHIVALLVPVDDGQLKPHQHRDRRDAEAAPAHVVHADVHIFRKPAGTSEATRQRNADPEARYAA
jgi:hypothetical protein